MNSFLKRHQVSDDEWGLIKIYFQTNGFTVDHSLSDSQFEEHLRSFRYQGEFFIAKGITTLHMACMYANIKLAKILLGIGVDGDALDEYGNNCLHYTCRSFIEADRKKYTEMVKYLLDTGADYKKKNKNDETPLDLLPCSVRQELLDYAQQNRTFVHFLFYINNDFC